MRGSLFGVASAKTAHFRNPRVIVGRSDGRDNNSESSRRISGEWPPLRNGRRCGSRVQKTGVFLFRGAQVLGAENATRINTAGPFKRPEKLGGTSSALPSECGAQHLAAEARCSVPVGGARGMPIDRSPLTRARATAEAGKSTRRFSSTDKAFSLRRSGKQWPDFSIISPNNHPIVSSRSEGAVIDRVQRPDPSVSLQSGAIYRPGNVGSRDKHSGLSRRPPGKVQRYGSFKSKQRDRPIARNDRRSMGNAEESPVRVLTAVSRRGSPSISRSFARQ